MLRKEKKSVRSINMRDRERRIERVREIERDRERERERRN